LIETSPRPILEFLGSIPPGRVYQLAPKHYFLRGYDYYQRGTVLEFDWRSNNTTLVATVAGTRRYEVEFTAEPGVLFISCDCPAWSTETNCKHVVCAFLTAKNLLDPEAFRLPGPGLQNRAELLAQLEGRPKPFPKPPRVARRAPSAAQKPAKAPEYSIVFDLRMNEFFVRYRGRRLGKYEILYGPEELRPLGEASPWGMYGGGALLQYFAAHGDAWPIRLRGLGEERLIRYEGSLEAAQITVLDAHPHELRVSRAFSIGERLLQDGELLRTFALDAEQGTFHPITKRDGGGMFMEIADACRIFPGYDTTGNPAKPYVVPAAVAGNLILRRPPAVPGNDSALRLLSEGMIAEPEWPAPTHRLTILPAGNPKERWLAAQVMLGDRPITPRPSLFGLLAAPPQSLSAPLRANKRRSVFSPALLDLLVAPTKREAGAIIDGAARHEAMDRSALRREVRHLLRSLQTVNDVPEEALALDGTRWLAHAVDKAREPHLFRVPCAIFGWEIFQHAPSFDRMRVDAGELMRRLPRLHRELAAQGIALYHGRKPVRPASWEFSVDAVQASGIDWFEIRPEIRCDGRLLDQASRERLLSDGLLEEEGEFRIVDPEAEAVFAAIAGLARRSGPAAKKHQEVVRVPRLAILDWVALRRSGVRVRLPPEDEAILSRLLRFEGIPERPLPRGLKAKLRPYQRDGYLWLAFLYEHRFGACLADDMGLGKTLQAIALLAGIRAGTVHVPGADRTRRPHLVVVPPSLLFNWESEIRRFFPRLTVTSYTGAERTTDFGAADVVLTSYGLLRRDIDQLQKIPFDVAVFDEAQAVKNILADTTGAARRIKARFVLAMTGTPLENHIGEYLSILDLALPGLVGDAGDAAAPLSKASAGRLDGPVLERLVERTRPFVLRRTKSEILAELPPKVETDLYLDLSEAQKALYERTVAKVRDQVEEAYRSRTEAKARIIALTAILRLRQICVAPQLLDPRLKETSPKIVVLIEQLRELADEGHRALVFSQFTSFLDLIEPHLSRHGIAFARLDGSTPVAKRRGIVENFQSADGPAAFLVSLKAGGQGLNLTRASYVFHLDPWWNPAVENQASDRAHRIGQSRTVTITRMLMRHTVEEKMMELKRRKLELYHAVLAGDGVARRGTAISREDFAFLLG
jgi:non-specific serine/threonine protein kinase